MDIQNLLNNADLITALKWTGTILVTGFIAQFGRRFAEHLIDRGKKRREAKRLNKISIEEPAPGIESSLKKEVKAASKIEKKRLKAEKKKLK